MTTKPPSNSKILRILKKTYTLVKWRHAKLVNPKSFNFIYKLIAEDKKTYIVKVYRNFKKNVVDNEKSILQSLINLYPAAIQNIKNINNSSLTIDSTGIALTVSEYVTGKNYRSSACLKSKQLKLVAHRLAELHNLNTTLQLRPIKVANQSHIAKDIMRGVQTYKKIVKGMKGKNITNFDKMISHTLEARLKKFESVSQFIFQHLELNRPCYIHGDYAPSNIIFENKDIAVLDWEHARLYAWQYDLFRALCNFSSSGKFTPYDSNKDVEKIIKFLKFYFERRIGITQNEVDIFKLMPVYFCFIDTFPFGRIYLKNEKWAKKYLPKDRNAYEWWQVNAQKVIDQIDSMSLPT